MREVNDDCRNEYIKMEVRKFPHISACEGYGKNEDEHIDVKTLADTLNLDMMNHHPCASKKNIEKVLDHFASIDIKIHVLLPAPDVILSSLLGNIKVSTKYRPGLDEGMFYIEVPKQFIEKKSYEKYKINCELGEVKTLKYDRSPTMGLTEISFIFGDGRMISDNYDEFKRMTRHIKMYNSDIQPTPVMFIGEQYRKSYREERIYERLFEIDKNLDNM
jgi:hypothetical protein